MALSGTEAGAHQQEMSDLGPSSPTVLPDQQPPLSTQVLSTSSSSSSSSRDAAGSRDGDTGKRRPRLIYQLHLAITV